MWPSFTEFFTGKCSRSAYLSFPVPDKIALTPPGSIIIGADSHTCSHGSLGTLAIGSAGSKNAGLLAASILSLSDQEIESKLKNYRKKQSDKVRKDPL